MSTGAAGKAEDLLPWPGVPGRDEFFWITEVNKATLITNTAKGLLTKDEAARVGQAVKAVAEECAAAGSARPEMYIRCKQLLTKVRSFIVTVLSRRLNIRPVLLQPLGHQPISQTEQIPTRI